MITIALDEGGHFENIGESAKCMFVGGVIFKYNSNTNCKKELCRLQQFFKETCNEVGCKYPEDLHYNRIEGKVVNGKSADKVKKALIENLSDFLNAKGKWQNDSPNGTYYIYAVVGDKEGIGSFIQKGISNLIDDNQACNRYEHMAYRVIENILFYNPVLLDNEVRLNLATRVIATNDDEKITKEVLATGHERFKDDIYKVTNSSSFRAALATMIQNSNRTDIQFNDLRAESIYYYQNEDKNLKQGFLYLSDTICSLFSDILKGCNRADTGIEKLWQKCQEYAYKKTFFWTYNEFDQRYRKLYRAFERKDYYETLKEMYSLSKESEKNYSVYETLWFTHVKKGILFSNTLDALSDTITKLDKALVSSAITVVEARFIYNLIKPRIEELCTTFQSSILFRLYKVELAINNHEGNYPDASKSFEKCMEYSQYVSVEEYLELRNMYSVSLCDSQDFEKAIEVTKETLEWGELLIDVKKAIYPHNDKIFVHYGRTLSQLGQCYAFDENFDSAFNYFKKAISSFGTEKGEINRTLSYLLHAAIEAKNASLYEQYSSEYFDSTDRKEQLLRLLSEDNIPNSFGLYVYLKAYYVFYLETAEREITEDILQKIEKCKKYKNNDQHPWEMIFKYAAFLSASIENKKYREKGSEYISLAKALKNPEGILKPICDEIDIQYKSVLNGKYAFENSKLSFMYR